MTLRRSTVGADGRGERSPAGHGGALRTPGAGRRAAAPPPGLELAPAGCERARRARGGQRDEHDREHEAPRRGHGDGGVRGAGHPVPATPEHAQRALARRVLDSAPACATNQPWTESAACCPVRCRELYETLRGMGYPHRDAHRLTISSLCFNGLTQLLGRIMNRARIRAMVIVAAAALWPAAARAFDSKCYQRAGNTCSSPGEAGAECTAGPNTARNRWRGPHDEHRQLFAAAAAGIGLPPHLTGDVALSVFSSTTNGPPAPTVFPLAYAIVPRCYSIDEMAQLPDFSYGLWDWAGDNQSCPIDGASAQDCHDFGTHMGALNSSHFVPQSGRFFQHYHGLALARARQCADVRARLANLPRFTSFVEACDQEAFTYRGDRHHYLQDAWSTGHMWQRWAARALTSPEGGAQRSSWRSPAASSTEPGVFCSPPFRPSIGRIRCARLSMSRITPSTASATRSCTARIRGSCAAWAISTSTR